MGGEGAIVVVVVAHTRPERRTLFVRLFCARCVCAPAPRGSGVLLERRVLERRWRDDAKIANTIHTDDDDAVCGWVCMVCVWWWWQWSSARVRCSLVLSPILYARERAHIRRMEKRA